MKSPAYWNTACYDFFMKHVWRQTGAIQAAQWKSLIEWIPEGAHVTDVAAGTGRFYLEMLAGHVGAYQALDINPAFVEGMKRQGIVARYSDIRKDPIPPADIVLVISAFYHFKETAPEMLAKLLDAARERLIILEPVGKKMTDSNWRDSLRAALVNIGEGPIYNRYDHEELESLCNACGTVEYAGPLPGNACICVLRGRHPGNQT